MYTVKPRGINIKQSDRNVADGFLQESINLQWRDGSYRPIPERLTSDINNLSNKDEIILHKVSDEDRVNVLMIEDSRLSWYGTIEDGVYTPKVDSVNVVGFPLISDVDSLSFTILNSLIYFMSSSQEFYYKVQFNEVTETYESNDMYAWKDLIAFFPRTNAITLSISNTNEDSIRVRQCGIVCIRFTLVLNTGEEVLHSPIYPYVLNSFSLSSTPTEGEAITNIHTLISTKLEFENVSIFEEDISAINIYASAPKYVSEYDKGGNIGIDEDDFKRYIIESSEEPFYLIRTIENIPSSILEGMVLIQIGSWKDQVTLKYGGVEIEDYYKIDGTTIAAGINMPVDNFSYHRLFGDITSNNGRLIVSNPKTVLSGGHIRSLCTNNDFSSKQAFSIETEDGKLIGESNIDVRATGVTSPTKEYFQLKGLLSYPDLSAFDIGVYEVNDARFEIYKTRANNAHNLSCNFDISNLYILPPSISDGAATVLIEMDGFYEILPRYIKGVNYESASGSLVGKYNSNNRMQFSEVGEFSVWPAINSYRVGEGIIKFIGSNSIDPANMDYIAPLIIGTSEGVFSVNYDTSGTTLIQSITKIASMPALSAENIQIDQALVYLSDKGLMVINSGSLVNITKDFFPDQGSGDFPIGNVTYPNYNLLTADFFGGDNPYLLTDIIDYMKGAIFAYDGRRNNLWCCNSDNNFSLIYNLEMRQWDMSTYVFDRAVDFLGTLSTAQGDIYSRFLVRNNGSLDILSGEDPDSEVYIHLLTRPIKMQYPDQFKKIRRLIGRCVLYRNIYNGYAVDDDLVNFTDDDNENFTID